jgi:hypothetical protein
LLKLGSHKPALTQPLPIGRLMAVTGKAKFIPNR